MDEREKIDLSNYDRKLYDPGVSFIKRAFWYFISIFFFQNSLVVSSGIKKFWIRAFGGKVGKGVVIKPKVNIKFPWNLQIGNYSWIGENVWIDNHAMVVIGNNVCLSQGALLLTGSRYYDRTSFAPYVKQITLEDGVWIAAKAIVCNGVTCHSHSVLGTLSVATKDMEEYSIYQGNPAVLKKERVISK
ncbi:MAG: colanic acid biosynthesis acetyltransferase WcaF [Bacteroidetes bacterium]|nr:colanic acid biosynthesis acetyltransferase WcaF [Bacteroidota bacterium]